MKTRLVHYLLRAGKTSKIESIIVFSCTTITTHAKNYRDIVSSTTIIRSNYKNINLHD